MTDIQAVVQLCRIIIGPTFVEVEQSIMYECIDELRMQGYFVVQIDTIPLKNLDDLLNAFYEKCYFPDYFGFNEAALKDCLVDFSWLPAAGYIFVFLNIHQLDEKSLRIFLRHFALAHQIKERKARIALKLLLPVHPRNRILQEITDTWTLAYLSRRKPAK